MAPAAVAAALAATLLLPLTTAGCPVGLVAENSVYNQPSTDVTKLNTGTSNAGKI